MLDILTSPEAYLQDRSVLYKDVDRRASVEQTIAFGERRGQRGFGAPRRYTTFTPTQSNEECDHN